MFSNQRNIIKTWLFSKYWKTNHAKKVSSCITEKFNGFYIFSLEHGKKLMKKFRPVDITFKRIKKEDKIKCYFSKELHLAYRSTYNERNKIKGSSACPCYHCSNFNWAKLKFEKHIENCSGISGIAYNFNTQNFMSLEDNTGYKADLLFVVYINFETTPPTGSKKNERIFVVLQLIAFTFRPNLNLDH